MHRHARRRSRILNRTILAAVLTLLSAATLAFDLATTLGVASAVPYAVVALLACRLRNARWLLTIALLLSGLTLLGWYLSPAGGELWKAATNRGLALVIIWAVAALGWMWIRADGRLEDNEGFLQAVLNTVSDGIIVLDAQGIVLSFNPAAERMFGYPASAVVGRNFRMLILEGHRELYDGYIDAYLRTGEERVVGIGGELEGLRRDGSLFPIALAVAETKGGKQRLFTGTIRDISERKLAMQNLLAAKEQAEAANAAKSRFLANMSHELRTPLNAIIGYSEILEENARDEERAQDLEDLQRITGAGRQLLSLISQILDLARSEDGEIAVELNPVPLEKLIGDVSGLVQPLLDANGNELVVEETCSAELVTDELLLRQILTHLVGNAAKFTERGRVALRCVIDGQQALFEVRDTGIGMSEDTLAGSFEAFTQADEPTVRKYGGAGLGLTVCKRLCGQLGGQIEIESEVGVGTTVTVLIPNGGTQLQGHTTQARG